MNRELLQKAYVALDGQWWAQDLCRQIENALAAPTPEPGHDCSQCRTPQACKSEQMCLSTLYRGQFPPAAPAPVVPDGVVQVPWSPQSAVLDTPVVHCPTCYGDDMQTPCAYPEGGQPGCLRDKWLSAAPAVPLTDEQLARIAVEDEFLLYCDQDSFNEIARAVEQAHGIGGGGK